jgi:hypothetical protein
MRLRKNWRTILRKAWTIRILILAGLLTALEVILPHFSEAIPHAVFASVNGMLVGSAFVARLMAQKEIDGDDDDEPNKES